MSKIIGVDNDGYGYMGVGTKLDGGIIDHITNNSRDYPDHLNTIIDFYDKDNNILASIIDKRVTIFYDKPE